MEVKFNKINAYQPNKANFKANPDNKVKNTDTKSFAQLEKQKTTEKTKKALVTAGVALAALGVAFAVRSKAPNIINKLKGLKQTPAQKLQKEVAVTVGHNKILDETTKRFVETADEMAALDPLGYKNMADEVKKLLKPCDASILPKDGVIYHGTSLENAKNIVKKGVSPFVSNQHGRELGIAFYTTPNPNVADFFGSEFSGSAVNGIVLPFKMKTDKVAYMTEELTEKMNQIIGKFYMANAKNTTYFKEQGVSLPGFADSILGGICPGKNVTFLQDTVSAISTKLFKEAGFDAAYLGKAITAKNEPLFGVSATKALEEGKGLLQSQFAIFDGTKIELIADKIRDAVKLV